MNTRRSFLASLTLAASATWLGRPAAAALDGQQATAFVKSTGDRLVAIVNSNASDSQKHAELAPIIDATVDIPGIARFCLGRYWRQATPAQQQQYIQVFRAVLVTNIAGQLGAYRGVRFTVGSLQPREDGDMVSTTIERPNNQPSRVQWLVANIAGSPKIEDMITEGVSLRLTQRSDYESFLGNNGGKVDALIQALQRKAAQPQPS